jgi:hypothetical protein
MKVLPQFKKLANNENPSVHDLAAFMKKYKFYNLVLLFNRKIKQMYKKMQIICIIW